MEKSADAFRTISEVAVDLNVPQHVLRFWESKFPQVKPLKRGGGRRYYRPGDVVLLRSIRHLLYADGYTIRGVQQILKGQGAKAVAALAHQAMPPTFEIGHEPDDAERELLPPAFDAPTAEIPVPNDALNEMPDTAPALQTVRLESWRLRILVDELRACAALLAAARPRNDDGPSEAATHVEPASKSYSVEELWR